MLFNTKKSKTVKTSLDKYSVQIDQIFRQLKFPNCYNFIAYFPLIGFDIVLEVLQDEKGYPSATRKTIVPCPLVFAHYNRYNFNAIVA